MTIRFNPILGVTFGFLLSGLASTQGAPVELDLEAAFARAPEANFQILLSGEALTAEEESTRITRSGLLPQVSLNASQSRAMSPNVDALTEEFPDFPERFFNDRFDALVRARLQVLDFRKWDDWNISRLNLKAVRYQVENTVQEILQQIASAYYAHWRNQRRLDVIDANLERDRLLLRIAENQQEAGVATRLDVTRAEVALAGNELARLQQETVLLGSALRLKRVLNIPLEREIVIVDEEIDPAAESVDFSPSRFTGVLNQRQDYRQLETEVEREVLSLDASRRDRLPSIDLSGEWGYAAESWDDDMREQWSVSLGLSVPVFEGFRLSSQTRLAASNLRRKELELRDLAQQIESDYRLVLQDLDSRAGQVDLARRVVSLNERELELARIRFEEGVADNSDVVDAQAALADAEDTLVEAEFQYVQARIQLARIEGEVRSILD
ncbi:MAG: TolC family protein [Oceanipulchritudo sp.]